MRDSGEWMTGECTAYLQHMLSGLAERDPVSGLAEYTIFLHDDAPRHLKPDFLSIVFRSLALGTYNVSFLNLAHERYVSAATPCLRHLYEEVMGRPLAGRLSTYCCGHFVVKASRLHEIPVEPLQRLLKAVQTGSYTAQVGGPCEVAALHRDLIFLDHVFSTVHRFFKMSTISVSFHSDDGQVANMPCYVVEYLWHVLLGEPDLLPWRSEDVRLPLALRYEGGRETRP